MSFQANWCIFAGLDVLGDLGWCHTLRMEADAFWMPSLHVPRWRLLFRQRAFSFDGCTTNLEDGAAIEKYG